MIKIKLPDVLVKVAGLPDNKFYVNGKTAGEALDQICKEYVILRKHLFHVNGQFKDHFLLTVDGKLVDCNGLLDPESNLDIIMAASGGLDTPDEELSKGEIERFARHITLPGVGVNGQQKLKKSRILIIGTGGLGSPVSLYLAAAGIGTIGLIDFDIVESSNLQRQVVHGISSVGESKVESAKRRLMDLNEALQVETFQFALSLDNALDLIGGYDIVIDGSDNFTTRYLVNDACVLLGKPLIYGAIYQFDGQASVFNYRSGPCYRCLFPQPPPPSLSPNCNAGGVIGVLPGVIGMVQATEALKILLGLGRSLSGRLLQYDALTMEFGEVKFGKRQDCHICSSNPKITELKQVDAECSSGVGTHQPLPSSIYVSPLEFKSIISNLAGNLKIVDVREPSELEICRLENSINIPLDELVDRCNELDKTTPCYIVCLSGRRAETAADILISKGYKKIYIVKGGLKRWSEEIDHNMPMY